METFWRTISRLAPSIVTPPVSACLIAESTPKRTNATRIDSNVSPVRSFFRFRLLQMRCQYLIPSFHRFVTQLALVQLDDAGGAGGRVGVLRPQEHTLAALAAKRR